RRSPRLRVRNRPDRHRVHRRIRAGEALPRDHRRRASRARSGARARRPHPRLPRRRRRLARGRAGAWRAGGTASPGVGQAGGQGTARSSLEGRDRGRRAPSRMRLATLAGLYVAVVLSAQIGAQKFIRLPFTHLVAPGGVYSIGVALALVQLAHYSGVTRPPAAINSRLMIALDYVDS